MAEKIRKILHASAAHADLGQELADAGDFEEMIRSALHVVLGTLAIRRGAVAEYDCHARLLKFVATRGIEEAPRSGVPFNEQDAEDLCAVGACGLLAIASEDTEAAARLAASCSNMLASPHVELVVPLLVRRELVGVILLGGKASGEPLTADDGEVIGSLARYIGIGIHNHRLLAEIEQRAQENRRLYDDLRTIYRDTVRAFAAAIDCKDKYTQGHSERVGKYSEIIAREMGWNDDEVEGIAVAGYLHDIGKLVVDREIINAPYRIDAKQSSELNRHPAAGYEILAPINHPYADIPLMARYHHERPDGRGYPEGLTDEQIPIGAKIVSLADSFDAMTTDRPYRRRRAFNEVVEDIRSNTGKQFAPEVVIAFCRALLREIDGEKGTRQITRLLGKGYIEPERIKPQLAQLIADIEAASYAVAGVNG